MDSDQLDDLDRRLAHAFQLDGRVSFSRLAEVLGVSDQTVARRYHRLRSTGVLRVVGVPELTKLGRVQWLVRVRCMPDAASAIATALARRDDTSWVSLTSGGTEIVCFTAGPRREASEGLLLGQLPRTPRVVSVTAHRLLRRFAGGPTGWPGRANALDPAAVAALTPSFGPSLTPAPDASPAPAAAAAPTSAAAATTGAAAAAAAAAAPTSAAAATAAAATAATAASAATAARASGAAATAAAAPVATAAPAAAASAAATASPAAAPAAASATAAPAATTAAAATAAEGLGPAPPSAPSPASGPPSGAGAGRRDHTAVPLRLEPGDEALFAALSHDGRASLAVLAAACGRSETTVRRRLEHLRSAGALYFDVEVDVALLGASLTAVLWLTVTPARLDAVAREVATYPEVALAAATTGPTNLAVTVGCRDGDALYDFLATRLGALDGVRQVEAAPMIRTLKRSGSWRPPLVSSSWPVGR